MEAYSFCRLCDGRCSLKLTLEGGKLQKVTADPHGPAGRTGACEKAKAWPEILYHPERILRPMIKGKTGLWRETTWEEALDYTASRLLELKERHGAKSIAFLVGHPKGLEHSFVQRLARAFGSPNVVGSGHICHQPGETASQLTLGGATFPDPDGVPRTFLFWGSNFEETRYGKVNFSQYTRALKEGAKVLVVDPRRTSLAKKACLWIRPRPGCDDLLAFCALKIAVEEGFYEPSFVKDYTLGFDALKEHLSKYDLQELCQACWVDPKDLRDMVRLYFEGKPSILLWGNALDHSANSFQTFRSLVILKAITGNLDLAGGEFITVEMPPLMPSREFLLAELKTQGEKIDAEFPLLRTCSRQAFLRAVLRGEPYGIKAALAFGSNPLMTYPDASKAKEALERLEFFAVADAFMTPSAALAHVFFPIALNFEFEEIAPYPPFDGFSLAYPKLLDPPGECRPDYWIINELGKRLGLTSYFWDDPREALDLILSPSGMSFKDFLELRAFQVKPKPGGYKVHGFRTRSGKVELYSENLKALGLSPLPTFQMPEPPDPEYPLLLTSAKEPPYLHSEGRNINALRSMKPEPTLEIHPETAAEARLKEGEWAWIETPWGKIRQRVKLREDLPKGVVFASYGWWFPEKGERELYGWDEANLNLVLPSDPPYDRAMGSLRLRGVPCKVYPCRG